MITHKELTYYKLLTMDQYYDLIIRCRMTGKFNAAENLIIQLSRRQKVQALAYFYQEQNKIGRLKLKNALGWCFDKTTDILNNPKVAEVESPLQLKMF